MTKNGTPLTQAVANKRADVAALLLGAGADPNLRYTWPETLGGNKDFLGKTALELAQTMKLKRIIAVMENPATAATAGRPQAAADIPKLWKSLEEVLSADCKESLHKPAEAADLDRLAKAIGQQLTEDFKASYMIYNGQDQDGVGLFIPDNEFDSHYYLMSIDEILVEWNNWKGLVDGGEFRNDESNPDDGVRADWWHPGWIPFMTNGSGDSICIDLAPADKGAIGQVFMMNHEAAERPLLACTFAAFLSLLIEKWQQLAEKE
jgi:cell wall assembly regulator SMI1